MKIKKNDLVQVIAGKDVNKQGKVMVVDRAKNKVIVEGVNIVTRHKKANRQNQQGGIIKTEAPINASNVMYVHNGKPSRLGYQVTTTQKDGKTVKVKKRVVKSTGDIID